MNATMEWGPANPDGDLAPILQASVHAEALRKLPPLNLKDRCDRCGAQAIHRLHRNGSFLEFCNHHHNKTAPATLAQGFTVIESLEVPT